MHPWPPGRYTEDSDTRTPGAVEARCSARAPRLLREELIVRIAPLFTRETRAVALAMALCGIFSLGATDVFAQSGVDKIERPKEEKPEEKKPEDEKPKPEPEEIDPLDAELDALDGSGLGAEGGLDEITRLTKEISENMKTIEKLLDSKNTGEQTQSSQSQTIEQIDKLIELVEAASQSSGGGGGGSGKPQSSSSQEQDQKRGQKNRGMSQEQKQEQGGKKPQSSGSKPEDSPEPTKNDQTSEGDMPPDDDGDLKDGADGRGRWGRLPRTDIEKMYDSGNRKLPEKYRILLEEYYRRLPVE